MASKRKSMLVQQSQNEEKELDKSAEDMNISDDEEGGTRIGDIYIPPPAQPHCSTESKGPRLIITQIENENFKSYAGKVTLGPFHHCFTAIIGPNGSGKSNVIDSMLFVFGYRAQKIRSKKLSVLLHNSARFPNTQSCTVSVHFQQIIDKEGGECLPVENSNIVISRTAFKDNSSFYTINKRRVQFKEVATLLKQHGVDLDHNRFLILQGEVESIAMMKSKAHSENECGMLEYLEDIVGTTRYKKPLIQINTKVELLTEERTEKHNRCKLAERDMKDLEQPYNEAVEYLKLENTLTRTQNLQIQKYLSEQNKKLLEVNVEKEKVGEELKQHDEKYEEIKRQRLEKESQIKEEIANFEKMCKLKEEMETKLKKALNNFTEVQTTMAATNKRRKQNKQQLQKNEEKLIELQKLPEKNEKEIEECKTRIDKLSSQKNTLETELQKNYAEIKDQTQPLIEKRESLEGELIDLQKNVNEAKAALTVLEQELKILKHDETTEKRKYESMKSSFEESKIALDEKTEKVKEYQNLIPTIRKEIENKTVEVEKLRDEEEKTRLDLRNVMSEITEKKNSMQIAKSNNKVLDSLMRQKVEGKIPGILGRLGDLGGIDAKYDVAISTACGRLDNIVVDTVNTAQTCIEHLKKYDIGRASFIALEKVQHLQRYCETKINTPENVPRLFDLVRVEDNRVVPAFYFALRNTLVADNLDQGTKIAYGPQRFRVVTLKGDVIETSGTMSGGGRTQIRGKMGQKVTTKTKENPRSSLISQKALEDMQTSAENMQSKINYCQEQQGHLEKDINNLKISLQKKEVEIRKMSVTIESLSEQLPRIEAQLKSQKIRMEKTISDKNKVDKLEAEIDTKRTHFEKVDNTAKKIENKIQDLNDKIGEIHNEKIKVLQKKIDSLAKQIKSLNANISKLKVDITTSERNYKKTEKEIEDLKQDITNAENEIKRLNEKRTEYDNEGVEWTKKIEEAKEQIENANKDSSHLKKEIVEFQKQETEGNLKRVEIDQKMQVLEKKISDLKSQMPHWRNKLKPLKLHQIPGETEPPEPLKTYTEEELDTYKLQELQYQYSIQEEKLNQKKPNLGVIQEYTNKKDIYLQRVQILEDITNKRNEMRQLYDEVRKRRYTEFMKGFHIITRKLKEMYQMITQGGDAELELVDSMDPFTEGVSFSVRPPKKTWKNISNLSGGEKTLSSLALVFALHYYKPSPLYFMDEIDAALDFKNISIVAHYIKERTKNAQFIIISLRSNMFELSNYTVGIYKVSDCTDAICIKNIPPDFSTPNIEEQVQNIQEHYIEETEIEPTKSNDGIQNEVTCLNASLDITASSL
ncbi:structural maintenance of chromosomes protein 4 [Condylostylus longicornis]|uniref:structural maintenance of chromosomes protein 4 n=1 Tax=Condylostylus longicornis TaxID=2530218 RepID=UPI00244E4663|nr:structural maintenance of chromosomes protein 4 [Condylostylus longicornis]